MVNCGHIFLVGFSGSGKSTVGPLLARRLKRRFVDTDRVIESVAGCTITEIFSRFGEKAFRTWERETIVQLSAHQHPLVIALGGGALLLAANRKCVRASGCIVYLQCSLRELVRRLRGTGDRPLLAHDRSVSAPQYEAHVASLLARRRSGYDTADVTCSTTRRTPTRTLREILKRLESSHACCEGRNSRA